MSLINLVEIYNDIFGTNEKHPSFYFNIKYHEYRATYCSVWLKSDVNCRFSEEANENNCATSELWGCKFIDFVWYDNPSLDVVKDRVYDFLKFAIEDTYYRKNIEDALLGIDERIHIKDFYQAKVKSIDAVHNRKFVKIDDDIVSNKVCEIWCEANWNGNFWQDKQKERLNQKMRLNTHQYTYAGCPYYLGKDKGGMGERRVSGINDTITKLINWRIDTHFYLYSSFIHQFLAVRSI